MSVAAGDVCARCAQVHPTCCALPPGQEEFCFPLSEAERARMESAGAGAGHFEPQANTPGFVDNLRRLFPGEEAAVDALFPAAGGHVRLALTPEGGCRLLGPQGCQLPRPARPYYCLLYPFWMSGGRRLYFDSEQCLAVQESPGGAGLLARMGLSGADVRHVYEELRKAWGLPERT